MRRVWKETGRVVSAEDVNEDLQSDTKVESYVHDSIVVVVPGVCYGLWAHAIQLTQVFVVRGEGSYPINRKKCQKMEILNSPINCCLLEYVYVEL